MIRLQIYAYRTDQNVKEKPDLKIYAYRTDQNLKSYLRFLLIKDCFWGLKHVKMNDLYNIMMNHRTDWIFRHIDRWRCNLIISTIVYVTPRNSETTKTFVIQRNMVYKYGKTWALPIKGNNNTSASLHVRNLSINNNNKR